jgi:nitrate/nitrite transport system permease protein
MLKAEAAMSAEVAMANTSEPAVAPETRMNSLPPPGAGQQRWTAWASRIGAVIWPLVGTGAVLIAWSIASASFAETLPSPARTWEVSKPYIMEPFAKRGEMDQGILRFTWYSLERVVKGYLAAILIGTPLGALLGSSLLFRRSFDPLIQILRPVSPLAWLPLGLVLFQKPEPAAFFTIAMCSMWPTVLNTALGVASVPQDYLNVGRVLKLGRRATLLRIILPGALPYMFTGFRLSLGIAWLVIVAAEMLTGAPGVGGFLWQEYNSLIYEHIILCILVIGLVGYALDSLMGMAQKKLMAPVRL